MPDFTYTGAPGMYPMLRDAYGVQVGTVTPGDVAEFDEAPDAGWVPYEPGDDDRKDESGGTDVWTAVSGEGETGSEQDHDTAGDGQEEG